MLKIVQIDETVKKQKNNLYPPCQTLKNERLKRGWSQIDLAIELQQLGYTNINPTIICRFERGKQKPWQGAITLCCQLFRMTRDELFPEFSECKK
jgi:transcriptional regulator with XRE-family HTH domain